jgi:3-methyladenine DNA glycosylase Mpg
MSRIRSLRSSFYAQLPSELARNLLDRILVTRLDGIISSGRIVEVELYLGADDPACHAVHLAESEFHRGKSYHSVFISRITYG